LPLPVPGYIYYINFLFFVSFLSCPMLFDLFCAPPSAALSALCFFCMDVIDFLRSSWFATEDSEPENCFWTHSLLLVKNTQKIIFLSVKANTSVIKFI